MRPSLALKTTGLFVALFFLSGLAGCGVQSIPKALNQVEASVAEVTNQYKRRADLIPNLVNTVKGYASHEKETLEAVVNARASATSVKIDPSNSSPEQIQKFQQAQGGLSQALGRLMVVSERYPDLKADRNFRELQAQLEGTENRITIARHSRRSQRNLNLTKASSRIRLLVGPCLPKGRHPVRDESPGRVHKAPVRDPRSGISGFPCPPVPTGWLQVHRAQR